MTVRAAIVEWRWKGSAILVCFLFSVSVATGCVQVTGTSYEGASKTTYTDGAGYLRSFLAVDHHEDGRRMAALLTNPTNLNERSDYAVALIYQGRVKEAVDLLQSLEQEEPGSYVVAANLGTALELLGDNERALHWIREGIRRNPSSHDGTEWLHAKILEAKIEQHKDPNYFKNHSVLELNPASISDGLRLDGQFYSATRLAEAIRYQLKERVQFVKPPDPAVASLLFDYAAIEAATEVLESAKGILTLAAEYGYPAERVQEQIRLYDHKIFISKVRPYCWYALFLALLAGLVILPCRRMVLAAWKGLPKR